MEILPMFFQPYPSTMGQVVARKCLRREPGVNSHTVGGIMKTSHNNHQKSHLDGSQSQETLQSDEIVTIIHFNDVYNIEPRESEPVGGAARFATLLNELKHLNPLVLFSGDCLNPSIMSSVTRGKQMVPILNALNVNTAVFGNHEFDFGVDELQDLMKEMNFPWLMSNVLDKFTDEPLANGLVSRIVEWNGRQIGLMGLVEEPWLSTLSTLDREDLIYTDYVSAARDLSDLLKSQGAEFIIALTHMRMVNDMRLAAEVDDIDLILGGHDHDYEIKEVNNKLIIKSGSDFQSLTRIDVQFAGETNLVRPHPINVLSDLAEDPTVKNIVDHYKGLVDEEVNVSLGCPVDVDLDARFSMIRTQETNLGNLIADIMMVVTHSDVALINSGTFRYDGIIRQGEVKVRELRALLPYIDPIIVLRVTGRELLKALENGVSEYPSKDGRFPQIGGMKFGFDPTSPPGSRVDPEFVEINDMGLLDLDKKYILCTKQYVADGKDGYSVLNGAEMIVDVEMAPILCTMVRNHFDTVSMVKGLKPCFSGHHQSLLTNATRKSNSGTSINIQELEETKAIISPQLEGRIFHITDEMRLMKEIQKDHEIPTEVENNAGNKVVISIDSGVVDGQKSFFNIETSSLYNNSDCSSEVSNDDALELRRRLEQLDLDRALYSPYKAAQFRQEIIDQTNLAPVPETSPNKDHTQLLPVSQPQPESNSR